MFYVPTGSCHEVAEMLIATDGPSFAAFKDLLLSKIKSADADQVLAHLLAVRSKINDETMLKQRY